MPSRKMSIREQREARKRIRALEAQLHQLQSNGGTTIASLRLPDSEFSAFRTAEKLGHSVVIRDDFGGQVVRLVAVPRVAS